MRFPNQSWTPATEPWQKFSITRTAVTPNGKQPEGLSLLIRSAFPFTRRDEIRRLVRPLFFEGFDEAGRPDSRRRPSHRTRPNVPFCPLSRGPCRTDLFTLASNFLGSRFIDVEWFRLVCPYRNHTSTLLSPVACEAACTSNRISPSNTGSWPVPYRVKWFRDRQRSTRRPPHPTLSPRPQYKIGLPMRIILCTLRGRGDHDGRKGNSLNGNGISSLP